MIALNHITEVYFIAAFIEQQHIGMRIRLSLVAMAFGEDDICEAPGMNYLTGYLRIRRLSNGSGHIGILHAPLKLLNIALYRFIHIGACRIGLTEFRQLNYAAIIAGIVIRILRPITDIVHHSVFLLGSRSGRR